MGGEGIRHGDVQGEALRLGAVREHSRDICHDPSQGHRLAGALDPPRLQPGEKKEVLNDGGHSLRVAANGIHPPLGVPGKPSLQHFQGIPGWT